MKFINLKNHTMYSLLKGYGDSQSHISKNKEFGFEGVCFTDLHTLRGVLDLYSAAEKEKIPKVLGVEMNVVEHEKINNKHNPFSTITVYAKDSQGYSNLTFLTSMGTKPEYFFEEIPRTPLQLLKERKSGLIVTSGGLNGFLAKSILRESEGIETIREFVKSVILNGKEEDLKNELHSRESNKKEVNKILLDEGLISFILKLIFSEELQRILYQDCKFPISSTIIESIEKNETLSEQEKSLFINLMCEYSSEEIILFFKETFGDDFYLELSCLKYNIVWNPEFEAFDKLDINPQYIVNEKLIEYSQTFNIKSIIVQDTYLLEKSNYDIQNILIWNSDEGKKGKCFPQAQALMPLEEMKNTTIKNYPFISDEMFSIMCENTIEILNKCKDLKLSFRPSLPSLNYHEHYVNKVPVIIKRSLILELQKLKLWDEYLKDRIIENKSIQSESEIPQSLKNKYSQEKDVIDYKEMEERKAENDSMEKVLLDMENHFIITEPKFSELIAESREDIELRTALKTIIRNKKLVTEELDIVKLDKYISKKKPGLTHKDFPDNALHKVAAKFGFYKLKDDKMLLLGDQIRRNMLVEEFNIIQYNGILKLITYFMLIEDVSNFHKENNYLYGLGRGSGAGSLVAYGLDITDVDPIKEGLQFSRFLTKERIGEIYYKLKDVDVKLSSYNPKDAYNKLVELVQKSTHKNINKEWISSEMFFIKCNKEVAVYYLSLFEQGYKSEENETNSSVLYAIGVFLKEPKKEINASKTELPDIDYDTMNRDALKDYLIKKFGFYNVTLMGTFGKLKTKGAIKEIFKRRFRNMSSDDVNEFTKLFDLIPALSFKKTKDHFLTHYDKVAEIKERFNKKPHLKELVLMALDQLKSVGIHAGGIVVSSSSVIERVACRYDINSNIWVTEPDMNHVEWAGLIKYDFLGLNTLNDINKSFIYIEDRTGLRLSYRKINFEDPVIFERFNEADTLSIFQFNKGWVKKYLKEMTTIPTQDILSKYNKKPTDIIKKGFSSINDNSMFTSIFRPGPMEMGMHDLFINLIKSLEDVSYLHPSLEPVLKDTYGIMCYQEQVMATLVQLADFGPNDSVVAMKAMGKKKLDVLKGYKKIFVDKSIAKYPEMKDLVNFNITLDPKKYLVLQIDKELNPIDNNTKSYVNEYDISKSIFNEMINNIPSRKKIMQLRFSSLPDNIKDVLAGFNIKEMKDIRDLMLDMMKAGLIENFVDVDNLSILKHLNTNIDKYQIERNLSLFEKYNITDYDKFISTISDFVIFEETLNYNEPDNSVAGYSEVKGTFEKIVVLDSDRKIHFLLREKNGIYTVLLNNISVKLAEKIWLFLEAFAKYGFNKSHAVAYSKVSYICMWLKHYYPIEWKTSVLSGATKEDFKEFYSEWSGLIDKPDINESKTDFVITKNDEGEKILMPFSRIESVAEKAAVAIELGQPYKSFKDFYIRVNKSRVNKKIIMNLIFSGSFDSLRPSGLNEFEYRKDLVHEYYMLKEKNYSIDSNGNYIEGKNSLLNDIETAEKEELFKELELMSRGDFFQRQIDLLNLTSVDYVKFYKNAMTKESKTRWGMEALTPAQVQNTFPRQKVVVGGAIKSIFHGQVKKDGANKGKPMMFLKIVNRDEETSVTIFHSSLEPKENGEPNELFELKEGWPVMIYGESNHWNDKISISFEDIRVLKNKRK